MYYNKSQMKLNLNYTNDIRWERMSSNHKNLFVPNLFIHILYEFKDKIDNLEKINFAVETGTFEGFTSEIMAEHFEQVFTVEKFVTKNPYTSKNNWDLYQKLLERYSNIQFNEGDSEVFLEGLFKQYPDERFFILLDAHHNERGPLQKELEIIRDYSNCKNHVIMVDDGADLGRGDFPTEETFTSILKEINPEYTIINTTLGNQIYLIY
jgi:hypothetical protein